MLLSLIEKKPDPNAVPEEGAPEDEEAAAAPKKKSGKAPLVINFLDAPEVDEDDLFAPAEASSLLLSASGQSESRKSTHLLPDDIHFSSKQLLRMFLKPTPIVSVHFANWTICVKAFFVSISPYANRLIYAYAT